MTTPEEINDYLREQQALQIAQQKKRKLDQIPPLYRDSDPSRFPRSIWNQIKDWQPDGSGLGLGLSADPGKCKTRMIYHLLKRQDCKFKVVTSFQLQLMIQEKWQSDAQHTALQQCRRVPLLFIDDLGKNAFTASSEAELFDLIDERISHLRPIIFTSNLTGKALESMVSSSIADGLTRRLREFCTIIQW